MMLASSMKWQVEMCAEITSEGDLAGGLAAKLRGLAKQGSDFDIAQFQFLELDEIEGAYGGRWAEQQKRVKEVAHTFIKRRLGEGDILVPGADGFLIIYAEHDEELARRHAEEVKADLNAFYLGEGATRPPAEVSVSHSRLTIQELIKSIGEAEYSTAPENVESDDPLAGIEWKFQPVWDTRREAIFKYYIAPVLREAGQRVPGYQFEMDLQREYDYLAIDERSLEQSEIALRKMMDDGKQSLLGTTIHHSSLLKLSDRNRLFNVIDQFRLDLLRYRVVQIAAIPPGFPRMYLEDIYNPLKQRLPNITMSVAWNEPDLRSVVRLAPAGIGFTLSPSAMGENGAVTPRELFMKVKQAADMARAANIRFYFDGCPSRELVRMLRQAGIHTVSSPTVWPMVDSPSGAILWPSDRLAA